MKERIDISYEIKLVGKPECWDRVPLRARATARP